MIESLALAIERTYLALLDDPVLLAELANYSMETLPAGGYRYGAPLGLHDDTVIATALAWYGVEQGGSRFSFRLSQRFVPAGNARGRRRQR